MEKYRWQNVKKKFGVDLNKVSVQQKVNQAKPPPVNQKIKSTSPETIIFF